MEASVIAPRHSSPSSFLQRHPRANTLTPLPETLRNGLVAISVFSLLSFILCTLLWSYLTYKLISWRIRWRSRARAVARNIPSPPTIPVLDFQAGETGPPGESAKIIHRRNVEAIRKVESESPNQFLILIYNLFLADMHAAAAFLISTVWLSRDGIFIHTPACFVQGFFDSTGELASCCFITFIAIHTYLSVVKDYQPPQRTLYVAIICVWILAYLLPCLSILGTMNGREVEGFYTRAGVWCFISIGYWRLRLFTHYIFVFASLVATVGLYVSIYTSLKRQTRLSEIFPSLEPRHQQAFLIYPLAFVLCTLPLSGGRIAVIAGARMPQAYQAFAGTMVAANGLFDCIVFGSTRHSIIFGSTEQVTAKSTGLETFSFMRTPAARFGNEVWIQGGTRVCHVDPNPGVGGWLPFRGARRNAGRAPAELGSRSVFSGQRGQSQETLQAENQRQQQQHQQHQPPPPPPEHDDMVIHMDVVTELTVEVQDDRAHSIRYPEPSLSRGRMSFESIDSLCRRQERQGSTF